MYGFWGNARDLKRRFAQIIRDYNSQSLIICVSLYPEAVLRSCFEFLQKVFLGLMYPFSCVLWAIFWSFQPAIFLITEAKMPQKLIPNHRTINSKQLLNFYKSFSCLDLFVFRVCLGRFWGFFRFRPSPGYPFIFFITEAEIPQNSSRIIHTINSKQFFIVEGVTGLLARCVRFDKYILSWRLSVPATKQNNRPCLS